MTTQCKSQSRKARLLAIKDSTLAAVEQGSFTFHDTLHDIRPSIELSKQQTTYYSPSSDLAGWSSSLCQAEISGRARSTAQTNISIVQMSTLEGARFVADNLAVAEQRKIGVLNFASAKKPGGGFLTGAQAQEESLARSSTLYPSLMTSTAQQFYVSHKRNPKEGFYSHAMIYCPHVLLFRADNGDWVEPLDVDILVSAAVNAGLVRRHHSGLEGERLIEVEMRERMARVLYLFEQQGAKQLVLGSFGTGVFRNKVEVVARIWADMLAIPGAHFKDVFDRVVFAILDDKTFNEFKDVFESRVNATTGSVS